MLLWSERDISRTVVHSLSRVVFHLAYIFDCEKCRKSGENSGLSCMVIKISSGQPQIGRQKKKKSYRHPANTCATRSGVKNTRPDGTEMPSHTKKLEKLTLFWLKRGSFNGTWHVIPSRCYCLWTVSVQDGCYIQTPKWCSLSFKNILFLIFWVVGSCVSPVPFGVACTRSPICVPGRLFEFDCFFPPHVSLLNWSKPARQRLTLPVRCSFSNVSDNTETLIYLSRQTLKSNPNSDPDSTSSPFDSCIDPELDSLFRVFGSWLGMFFGHWLYYCCSSRLYNVYGEPSLKHTLVGWHLDSCFMFWTYRHLIGSRGRGRTGSSTGVVCF